MVVERVRSAALRVEEAIGWVCQAAAWATLPPLIGVTIYDVVGRQYFNTSSTRLMELEWHLFLAARVLRRHPLILRSRALP